VYEVSTPYALRLRVHYFASQHKISETKERSSSEMETKICPLAMISGQLAECLSNNCAWWITDHCSITEIPATIWRLEDTLGSAIDTNGANIVDVFRGTYNPS
jgi:hypothetical protein